MDSENSNQTDGHQHREPMERHTRPSLWGPNSWWRASLLILAGIVIVLLFVR